MLHTLSLLAFLSTAWSTSLTLYEHGNRGGKSTTLTGPTPFLGSEWNNKVSSLVADGDWELYTNWNYQGEGIIFESGVVYDNLYEYSDQFSSAKPSG